MPESLMEMTKSKHKGHLQNPVLLKEKPPKFLCLFDFPVEWLKTSAGCDGSSADKQEWNTWNTQVILHLKTNQVKKKKKTQQPKALSFQLLNHTRKSNPSMEKALEFWKFCVHYMKSSIILPFPT